jgi:hypothetical protein
LSNLRKSVGDVTGVKTSEDSLNSRVIDYFLKVTANLKAENAVLKSDLAHAKAMAALASAPRPEIRVHDASTDGAATPTPESQAAEEPDEITLDEIYIVHCRVKNIRQETCFLDHPHMFKGDTKSDHLRGRRGTESVTKYLESNPHVSGAVIKTYRCSCAGGADYHRIVGYKDGKLVADSPPASHLDRYIVLSDATKNSFSRIIAAHPDTFKGMHPNFSVVIYQPFLPFYIHNKDFVACLDNSKLGDPEKLSVKLICDWLEKECRKDWDEADELIGRKKINAKHYRKLFLPGEVLVEPSKVDPALTRAVKLNEWPWKDRSDANAGNFEWEFNGGFKKRDRALRVDAESARYWEMLESDGEKDITALPIYPIKFSEDPNQYMKLVARGNKFWRCRKSKLISYIDIKEDENTTWQYERRFMVDYDIYRRLHPHKDMFNSKVNQLSKEAFDATEPPDEDFLALLPPEIHGFDLANKAWKLIQVERLTDVTWNKDAFSRLVAPSETKELIEAAVMAHGHRLTPAPDIIGGKGQGLLILLHGGPGTGKTLTAESIAEAQERPLYRVTCGDIGIEPEEVEKVCHQKKSIIVP